MIVVMKDMMRREKLYFMMVESNVSFPAKIFLCIFMFLVSTNRKPKNRKRFKRLLVCQTTKVTDEMLPIFAKTGNARITVTIITFK